ncbi:MAG: hypothetical protein IKV03_03425 [Alphaproteobacteria bacterium]|nr:hypothetical protein [Alphaproteobacteria bacterium]
MLLHELQQLAHQDENQIKEWISSYGINRQDEKGKTLLMHSVSSVMTPKVTACLLDLGADVNIADHKGRTALDVFEQTMSGRISIARYSCRLVPEVSKGFSKLMLKMLALDMTRRSYPAIETILMGQKNLEQITHLIAKGQYSEALSRC